MTTYNNGLTLKEAVVEAFADIDDNDKIDLWNHYCEFGAGEEDHKIINMDDFDFHFEDWDARDLYHLFKNAGDNFDPNRDEFFTVDNWNNTMTGYRDCEDAVTRFIGKHMNDDFVEYLCTQWDDSPMAYYIEEDDEE